jgi:hypothetical protein
MKKFFSLIGRMIAWMVFITFCAVVVAFFVAIYNPEGVMNAVELVRSIVGG